MPFQIDSHAFRDDLKRLEADILEAGKEALKFAVEEAYSKAYSTTMFRDITGMLRNSIHSYYSDYEGEVAALAPYALYIEAGTKAHYIQGNPLLSFTWKGQQWSLPRVFHDAVPARPFMDVARQWGEGALQDRLAIRSSSVIAKFNSR